MLGCVGSSWGRTPTHRALSSQHPAFLLPKPPAGFSRLCRRLPDSMALHPHHPGIFCLTQVFCSIHYILCASQAACSRLLVSGPGPAVLPRPEKATGILPTTSPEALTGSTCRELKILGPRALSLTGDAAMGMGEQLGHGFSPGCWMLCETAPCFAQIYTGRCNLVWTPWLASWLSSCVLWVSFPDPPDIHPHGPNALNTAAGPSPAPCLPAPPPCLPGPALTRGPGSNCMATCCRRAMRWAGRRFT